MSSEEDGERIFHFFLFFLGPFSAHSSPLPQGGACQHPSGLNLPLVQILSLVCSPKLLRDQHEGWVWSLIYGIWSAVETREVFQLNSCERFHFMVHIAHKNPVVALAKGRLQVIVKRRYCKGSFYECKCCPLSVNEPLPLIPSAPPGTTEGHVTRRGPLFLIWCKSAFTRRDGVPLMGPGDSKRD